MKIKFKRKTTIYDPDIKQFFPNDLGDLDDDMASSLIKSGHADLVEQPTTFQYNNKMMVPKKKKKGYRIK